MRLLMLAVLAAIALPADAADNMSASLRYRSYRKWSLNLPAEEWFRVNDGIQLRHSGGDRFRAELDGERLKFDTDGDGDIDRTIKATVDRDTKVSTARVILTGKTVDGQPLKYAVRLRKDAAGWEWAPGGAMTGSIETAGGPVPVRIVDQNGNGRFNDIGEDAMVVGTGNDATYLSQTVLVGTELRELTVNPSGSSVSMTAFSGKTGRLDLTTSFDAKAVLLSAIIRSKDGKNSFDVAATKGGVSVPAGTYEIVSGTIGLGKQRVRVRQGRMKPIVLADDAKQSLDWGGPVKAEFDFLRAGSQVQFSPNSVWFYGNAGEEYFGWNPIGKSPEFKVKDKHSGQVIEVAILPGSC